MKILLFDAVDTELTDETLSICEDIFTEYGWSHDDVDYAHLRNRDKLAELPEADVIVAMGADAVKLLLPSAPVLKKCAGALMYHEELGTWVLPTNHPNVIYMPDGAGYNQFDIFYDHLRRAIDLCQGTLQFPYPEGREMDWEFIGHNGTQGYGGDPKVWSGYFECTDEEKARQQELLRGWLADLDAGEKITFATDTESFTTDHLKPMTMIQVYDPRVDKGFAFNWGVVAKDKIKWRRLFHHPNARWVLHNTKHDRKMLKQWLRVDLGDRDIDTYAYALGLTEKGNQTGLKYLSRQYCNAPYYEEGLEEWLDSDKEKVNYGHIRPDVLAQYGCYDVFFTYQLKDVLPPLVEREGTTWLVENILLPAQRTFAEIEGTGILVDQPFMAALKEEWVPLTCVRVSVSTPPARRATSAGMCAIWIGR